MYKKIFIITTFLFMAVSGFSQTNPQIEKALNDPKRAEKEAKADVYIQKNNVITDSVQTNSAVNNKISTKKKRNCKRKAH